MKKLMFISMILVVVQSQAVILSGGDGTQNTSSPTGGQGWDYVGKIDHATANSSVTYIDNNWFITAYHVQVLDTPTDVLLGGSSYSIDSGSWTRLQNSGGGDADLAMFRVTSEVGLAALTVRSSATANGSALTMIGNGRNRETSETSWSQNWVEDGRPTRYTGYKWDAGSTKRWGTNDKEDDAGLVNDGYGITDMFYTDFDEAEEGVISDDEAQGATYDSGGGVFYDTGSEWELAGLMITVGNYTDQPADTSVYGGLTYMADMQYYAGQINATTAIPEPSVLMLGSVFAIAGFCIRRVFMI